MSGSPATFLTLAIVVLIAGLSGWTGNLDWMCYVSCGVFLVLAVVTRAEQQR